MSCWNSCELKNTHIFIYMNILSCFRYSRMGLNSTRRLPEDNRKIRFSYLLFRSYHEDLMWSFWKMGYYVLYFLKKNWMLQGQWIWRTFSRYLRKYSECMPCPNGVCFNLTVAPALTVAEMNLQHPVDRKAEFLTFITLNFGIIEGRSCLTRPIVYHFRTVSSTVHGKPNSVWWTVIKTAMQWRSLRSSACLKEALDPWATISSSVGSLSS